MATDTTPTASSGNATEQRVIQVGENVYCAVGYALSNVIMVAVDGGKVIVDTTESVAAAEEVRAVLDARVPGPVLGVIYTHSHPDHVLGTTVFHTQGTEIWAHELFVEEIRTQMGTLSRTYRRRAAKQFGDCLAPGRAVATGIGPGLRLDREKVPPLLFPTQTFRDRTEFEIGGEVFQLEAAPGETRDHLFVYLPRSKTILSGDNIYQAFPNVYAIRGVTPRPVLHWLQSIDRLRRLEAEYLVPGHTDPIIGRARIQEILTSYRDALAFLLTTVIRLTNEGLTPDEMVGQVKLPEHLATHPYLQETYGQIAWSVRGIYEAYLGWFDGNATNLHPLAPSEHAQRMIELAGGVEAIKQTIVRSLQQGDPQWAAQLCDVLLPREEDVSQLRRWKSEAFEQLGEATNHPVARHYYLGSADEMRGDSHAPERAPIDAETLRDVPVHLLMQSLPMRLRSDKTADLLMRIGFEFTDSGKQFTLYIRRGVGEIRSDVLDEPDFVVRSTEQDFKALASGTLPAARAALTGRIRCTGGILKLRLLRSLLHPM